MRRSLGLIALLATVVAAVPAAARTRTAARPARAAAAPTRGHAPRASNTSNTAYRNQMKKFSDPFGANGR